MSRRNVSALETCLSKHPADFTPQSQSVYRRILNAVEQFKVPLWLMSAIDVLLVCWWNCAASPAVSEGQVSLNVPNVSQEALNPPLFSPHGRLCHSSAAVKVRMECGGKSCYFQH